MNEPDFTPFLDAVAEEHRRRLAALPERWRDICEARERGETFRAIAARWGVSYTTVYHNYRCAQDRLQDWQIWVDLNRALAGEGDPLRKYEAYLNNLKAVAERRRERRRRFLAIAPDGTEWMQEQAMFNWSDVDRLHRNR